MIIYIERLILRSREEKDVERELIRKESVD